MMTITRPPERLVATPIPASVVYAAPERGPTVCPWWAHLTWVLGASLVGFAVPALFAGGLHVNRAVFVLAYLIVSSAFLYAYVRWSGVDVYRRIRQHWVLSVVGAIVAGAFVVSNVLSQPASAAPGGLELFGTVRPRVMGSGCGVSMALSNRTSGCCRMLQSE
jgi:hypothetical protein